MVAIQTASVVITAASIVFGIVMGIIQFRSFVKTRQTQFYLEIYNQIMDKELHRNLNELLLWTWEDPHDFFEKYGPEQNLDEWIKFTLVTTYLENLGLLLHEKMVDVHVAANLIGTTIHIFWERFQPILNEFRQRYDTPKIMPMTEYLYEQVKRVRPR